jgi:nucleotide-binding universal stress UspA family protein
MDPVAAAEFGLRRALIALDGSAVAEAILPAFLRVAYPLGMEIVLVRVVVASEDPHDALESTERMKAEAEAYLRAIAATPAFEGLRVHIAVRTGEAPREIIGVAQEVQADLIAMTTHGRTGLRRLLFGSVAEAVLRAAPVPVFVVRAAPVEAASRVA